MNKVIHHLPDIVKHHGEKLKHVNPDQEEVETPWLSGRTVREEGRTEVKPGGGCTGRTAAAAECAAGTQRMRHRGPGLEPCAPPGGAELQPRV